MYVSNDNKTWKFIKGKVVSSAETTYMHVLNNAIKQSYMTAIRKKIDAKEVTAEFKNLSTYLYVSRFLKTYSWGSVISLEKSTKYLRHFGKEGNRLIVKLGTLDRPHAKENVRVHFEDSGLVNDQFCVEQSTKRKQLGLWKYGHQNQ